jgi:16S rRNA (cytosine967-C5)-methyltransferase
VVDVCAAPGGKTMAIAEGMENNGEMIATDLYKRKLYHIKEQAQRLGITIVKTWSWDATRLDSDLVETADRVLADVPCSGLGTVRKKPEIKYKNFEGEVENLPRIQKDILTTSSHYVKPGGILVYSTCTISERENQQVVRAFLKENRSFEQLDAKLLLPGREDSDGFFICKMQRKGTLI